jgi:hypothetical protein
MTVAKNPGPSFIFGSIALFLLEVFQPIHYTEDPIYVFPDMKLRGVIPNSYSHVSVSNFCVFPGSVCLFGCSKKGRLILGKYESLTEA